ncbi:DUF2306 domain-containing protein [Lacipirellula sp.]|uniref:DUF2306 domain-containing protein n=1 Tax=Lacipirellula sp. TaxID=2691419 RepID=UPI003D097AF9
MKRIIALLASLLIVKVTIGVVLNYGDYFPVSFRADFLLGRASYFFGAYSWAFYAHIVTGPVTLLLGLLLVSEWFRRRWPRWHRRLGKLQIALVTLVLAPSGAWMAWYAQSGAVAGAGFFALAIATGASALLGWSAAVRRDFAAHRRWMWRCFLLLCSAVTLRLVGGLAVVAKFDQGWIYPATAWLSWLVPLAAFEVVEMVRGPERASRETQLSLGDSGVVVS